MRNQKTLVSAAVILAIYGIAMVSIVKAELSLTINGLDTTKALKIKGKDNLIIAIADKTENVSVTCDKGKLKPLKEPGKYLFTFINESEACTISLNIDKEIVYQLILFYNPETDIVIVFGVDKEALTPPQSQLQAQSHLAQNSSTQPANELNESSTVTKSFGMSTAGYFWCPDLDNNGYVDFHDFAVFASNWQRNDYCVHGDFDDNQIVDFNDMAFFAYYWLADVIDDGNCPCAKSIGSMSSSTRESQTSGCGCSSAKSAMKKQPLAQKPRTRFVPGEVIVCFKPEVARSSVNDLATNFNCSVIRRLQRRNVYILQIPTDKTEEQVIELFKKRPDVIYAERSAYVYPDGQLIPNDPNFHRQWNLHQDSDADIDAPEGWYEINQKFGRVGDPNIVIAVIDTGVDYNHPDLAAAMWTDSFGNSGYDFVNSDNDPMDDSGHGTHVAGIAAAVTNNSIGVAGVAWGCKIMAVKALPCDGPGSLADLADSIDYAVANGAHVINMSLGTDYNSVLVRNAVQDAYDANVVLVGAAGNDANSLDVIEHYPSGYPEVICVSATDSNDLLASYSNYGSDVDFAAPGGDIMTEHTGCWWLVPEVTTCDKQIYSTMWNDTYAFMHGTSMATPHVSGLAALCLSTCSKLSAQKVKDCIINGVDDLGPPGKDDYYGWGRINVGKTFDYNVCDANYFCADWSDSLGSTPSCAKLIKVSEGCWLGAFENGQKAGEFVVLTYHTCCGWHGWYGSSSCDYSNEHISGKTWSKSLDCDGGTVQLTNDSNEAWEKITFTPTDDPNECCEPTTGACCNFLTGNCTITTEVDCSYTWLGADVSCDECYIAGCCIGELPPYIEITFSGIQNCDCPSEYTVGYYMPPSGTYIVPLEDEWSCFYRIEIEHGVHWGCCMPWPWCDTNWSNDLLIMAYISPDAVGVSARCLTSPEYGSPFLFSGTTSLSYPLNCSSIYVEIQGEGTECSQFVVGFGGVALVRFPSP